IFRLDALQERYDIARLPYTLRILLENVLRTGDDAGVEAIATWDAKAEPSREIAFTPARALLQDFTGVPAIVDLAAMRDAMRDLGGDARRAALDARAAGRRLPPDGQPAGGLDRDRPRPHGDADPAPDRPRREARRVLRRGARAAADRRPRDDREHVPGVRGDVR